MHEFYGINVFYRGRWQVLCMDCRENSNGKLHIWED
jgi:hypothetical protein